MKFKNFYMNEKIGEKYSYSCLLFDFPDPISREIQNWGKFNINERHLVDIGLENEIHVTVLYGIHDEDPFTSKLLVKNVKPFLITLGKMSKFDAPNNDVLKIDVFGEELHALRRHFESNLENTQTHSGYKPHVTIAFVEKNSCDRFIGNDLFEGRQVVVNAVDFSSKNGSRQRILLL